MFAFNQSVFIAIHHFAGQHVILDDIGIFFAEYLPYFLLLGFLVLAWQAGSWRKRIYILIEGALTAIMARGIIAEVIRFFYYHPRPFDFYGFTPLIPESGTSFPSGHAIFFFSLAMVVWFVSRKWGTWYFIFAVANGVARIYVGVHWPLDILGGAALGIFSGWLVHRLLRKSRDEFQRAGRNAEAARAI